MKNARKMDLVPDRATRNPAGRRTRAMIAGMLAVSLALIVSAGRSIAATETVIYSFTGGSDGNGSVAGLIVDKSGTLYGTGGGGASGARTVFEVTPPATLGGSWTENVLYSFTGGSDGLSPSANLVADKNGTLYGTTLYGGVVEAGCILGGSCGTVFALTPPPTPGGAWTERVVHSFTGGSDGAQPEAGLIVNQSGTLFGTTLYGGGGACGGPYVVGCGTVFSLTPPATPGDAWTESVLYSFAGGSDGSDPTAGVIFGPNGTLYGTTSGDDGTGTGCATGHSVGCGTVFALIPPTTSGGAWTENVIYSFTGGSDGANPDSGLIFGPNYTLYGTTVYGGTCRHAPATAAGQRSR